MLTDTKTNNLRIVLHQIWANLYVEFVVKNPLSPVEHPGGVGVANELFELGLDSFIVSCAQYAASACPSLMLAIRKACSLVERLRDLNSLTNSLVAKVEQSDLLQTGRLL